VGLFDSKSTTNQTTTSQNAGFSEIGGSALSLNISGAAGKGARQDTTVNMLDGGAIAGAFGFASDAQREALRQVELAGANSRQAVTEAVAAVSESARTESENLIQQALKWGTFAVLGYAALRAFGKG